MYEVIYELSVYLKTIDIGQGQGQIKVTTIRHH